MLRTILCAVVALTLGANVALAKPKTAPRGRNH